MNRAETQSAKPRPARAAVLVVLSCIVAYSTALNAGFVFDDFNQILGNPDLQTGASIGQILSTTPRPVTSLTFAINLAPFGSVSAANQPPTLTFHLVNLAIHIGAALLLLGILRRALPRDASPIFPLAGALLWALHPLNTQAVTYLVQRAESLMGMLALASVYLLFRVRDAQGPNSARWFSIGVVVCCALAMGAKAVAIVLPLALLLIDRAIIAGSFVGALRAHKGMYAGLALTLSVPFLTGIAQGVLDTGSNPNAAVGFAYEGVSPATYFLSQPGVILHYLRLAFVPAGQCLDYDWPPADSLAGALPSLIVVGALGVAALVGLVKNARWGLLVSLFFVLLAPTSSFVPIKDLANEHRMYLPLIPVVLLAMMLAGLALKQLAPPSRRSVSIGALALCAIALGGATLARNTVYQSDEAIWRDVLAKGGNALRAHTNLASIARRNDDLDSAIEHAQAALRIDPDLRQARGLLAATLGEAGRFEEANEQFEVYFATGAPHPSDDVVRAAYNRELDRLRMTAADYFSAGQFWEAEKRYRVICDSPAPIADDYYNLGMARARQNRFPQAAGDFERVLEMNPQHEQAKRALEITRQQIERAP